jgi:phosphoribosyl-ATP pyrophosphohydrolase/phosphoribosyl-AMP cyclohydrolase
MLAYVNEEAYNYMLEKKETCFYSRSRNELWHKGETSGHFQYIKGMYLDCDNDTLLIFVEQIENACHTGEYSCFFNEIISYRVSKDILNDIYEIIEDRKINVKKKSYTNYLFSEGIDKICKKIGEEASETIIAAKNNDNKNLIGEISDLTYHVLVLMANQGINIQDVREELVKRHKIEGNKKEKNIKGEY